MKAGIQTNEVYLEDVYSEFIKCEKKKKDQIEFFKDLKGLVDMFQNTLAEELERSIKVNELD